MIYNTNMKKVVLDTNVIVSGLQSNKGKSYMLLKKMVEQEFLPVISVPLVLEYEAILKKRLMGKVFSEEEINTFVDYVCAISEHVKIFYLWRPFLKDPFDDHILELAMTSKCDYIVTFNVNDFKGAKKLGIKAVTPAEFLEILKEE